MRIVYTEKFQWASSGFVKREFLRVERRVPLNISVSRKQHVR